MISDNEPFLDFDPAVVVGSQPDRGPENVISDAYCRQLMPKVKVDSETTSSVLSTGETTRLELPPYQRDYVWSAEKCEQLWVDLFAHLLQNNQLIDDATPYFLGNIIIEKSADGEPRELVDGQQRLTAICRMACAVRDALLRYYVNNDHDLSFEQSTELQEKLLVDFHNDEIRNRLQPQDRPEGKWLSSLVQFEWYLQLEHEFPDHHLTVDEVDADTIECTPVSALPWWIRKGTKLPVFRGEEQLAADEENPDSLVSLKFSIDVNTGHTLPLTLSTAGGRIHPHAALEPGDLIKLNFKRKDHETDTESNAEFEVYEKMSKEFLEFITLQERPEDLQAVEDAERNVEAAQTEVDRVGAEGAGRRAAQTALENASTALENAKTRLGDNKIFKKFPKGDFSPGNGDHLQETDQRIRQFVGLLCNVQFACCKFTTNALSYFRKMNDQTKMTKLETIDLMVAVTSEITLDTPPDAARDDEINQKWDEIFGQLYLESEKNPKCPTQFFYTFLLSQGITQRGGQGRYSEANTFTGLEKTYFAYDPITGWNKEKMLDLYRKMQGLTGPFLDVWQPEKRKGRGIFAGGNADKKLERLLLRALSHSGFTQHIPIYMASCQIFKDSEQRDRMVSRLLRMIVHYFLRCNSIPSARDRDTLTGNKFYTDVHRWCKWIHNRNLLPQLVDTVNRQIETFEREIGTLSERMNEAEGEEKTVFELRIKEKKETIKNLKNTQATPCTEDNIDQLLSGIKKDISESITTLDDNVPWTEPNLRKLNGRAKTVRLILWCNEISRFAQTNNWDDGGQIPLSIAMPMPEEDVEIEHICPQSPIYEDWPNWWSAGSNHEDNVENIANKMLLEKPINHHITNLSLELKRNSWAPPQGDIDAARDAETAVREAETAVGVAETAVGDADDDDVRAAATALEDVKGIYEEEKGIYEEAKTKITCPGNVANNCQHYVASSMPWAGWFGEQNEDYKWNKTKMDERAKNMAANLIKYWDL